MLREEHAAIQGRLQSLGFSVQVSDAWEAPFERTLFVTPGVNIPWDLLRVGLGFLERWEAAAPLWKVGYLAADVGTSRERRATEAVIRDLRVPLYAHELLFVRRGSQGEKLLEAFAEEQIEEGEPRLAFLRALYRTKPRFCALPRSWLSKGSSEARPAPRRVEGPATVLVEVKRNVFVRCRPGEEQMMLEWYTRQGRRRKRRQ
ncbi:MAG: hypothetical protein PHQ60_15685 [Sideroxydans sp.]|nr:hypothetical protein [Sideroxydans sp.]